MVIEAIIFDLSNGSITTQNMGEKDIEGLNKDPRFISVIYPEDARHTVETEYGNFVVPLNSWVRAQMHLVVDNRCGLERSKYETAIPGQEAVYTAKEAEANAWVLATSPVSTDYPFLYAESESRDLTMEDLVDEIISSATRNYEIRARLEGVRWAAKTAINNAASSQEMVLATITDWVTPLDDILNPE